jgi:hypothetical protein
VRTHQQARLVSLDALHQRFLDVNGSTNAILCGPQGQLNLEPNQTMTTLHGGIEKVRLGCRQSYGPDLGLHDFQQAAATVAGAGVDSESDGNGLMDVSEAEGLRRPQMDKWRKGKGSSNLESMQGVQSLHCPTSWLSQTISHILIMLAASAHSACKFDGPAWLY